MSIMSKDCIKCRDKILKMRELKRIRLEELENKNKFLLDINNNSSFIKNINIKGADNNE